MKLAFSSNAFKKHSLPDTIRYISEAGYAGIEIMCDRPHAWPEDMTPDDLKKIRSLLENRGLSISNISAFMMCAIQDFLHPSWIEPEPNLMIETSDQFLDFAEKFGPHRIGLNFDIGHAYCVGENPIEKVIELKEFIGHFHIEDIPESREHRHMMFGEGGIDIKTVLRNIENTGYQGFATVELYTYQDTAPQIAIESRRYLKEVCGYE